MLPAGFEPMVSVGGRPQICALDRAATGTGKAIVLTPHQKHRHYYIYPVTRVYRGDRGGTVVKVLRYKSEGRWFDPSWCHWNFSLT